MPGLVIGSQLSLVGEADVGATDATAGVVAAVWPDWTVAATSTERIGSAVAAVWPDWTAAAAFSRFRVAIIGTSTADGKNLEFDSPPGNPATDRFPYVWFQTVLATRADATQSYFTRPSLNSYEVLSASATHQPPGRDAPDPLYNIDAAIAANPTPSAIIIYLAGDVGAAVGYGFTLVQIRTPGTGYCDAELIPNLEDCVTRANARGIHVWISNGQASDVAYSGGGVPITASEITTKEYIRDRIMAVFPLSRAGAHYFDSYSVLRDPDGTMAAAYLIPPHPDADMHPNVAGHAALATALGAAGLGTVHTTSASSFPDWVVAASGLPPSPASPVVTRSRGNARSRFRPGRA